MGKYRGSYWAVLLALSGTILWCGCAPARATSSSSSAETGKPTAPAAAGDEETQSDDLPGTATVHYVGDDEIVGVVRNETGAMAGAVVRLQATENKTVSAADGSFSLSGLEPGETVVVTAWAEGYYIGGVETITGGTAVEITLEPYYTTDNPDYDWSSQEGVEGSLSCSQCHYMPLYEEWTEDAHSQAAVNERFLTMYSGTDVDGNQSPETRYATSRDYGRIPILPDPNKPYYGPGYKLDFPDTAGNCAACHVPGMAARPGAVYSADPTEAVGVDAEGVFCEFCHKVGAVKLDTDSGLPYANMPGVLSMRLYRPEADHQLFFGNFDDVIGEDSYLPLIEESAFCAPCHFGVFWDTVVYNSYGEWLESPYSDAQTGQTCQDCHMPPVDYDYIVNPEHGGVMRDSSGIFSHRMPGAMDEAFMQNALTMAVSAARDDEMIVVEVSITNDNTGHDVPSDSPLRHMILLVQAADANGDPLILLDGSTVPEWGGVGDPQAGYYAGLPGKAFARVLEELWTEKAPTGAYWNPTRVLSDNRLGAFETDASRYTFAAAEGSRAAIEVRLVYRRAYIELMEQKGWQAPDIIMAQEVLEVP